MQALYAAAMKSARSRTIPPGGPEATERALVRAGAARAVVLVEGYSDQLALETLAARRGRDLAGESVAVVPIGGAHAIGRFLARFGSATLAGLCDAGEEPVFRRALEHAGLVCAPDRAALARLGFHVCVADLEDELIRALGAARVEAVVEAHGDLGSFRTFQQQPAWRGRDVEDQLRRFLTSSDRRKFRYVRHFVEALDLDRVPRPLDGVLASVWTVSSRGPGAS